MQNTASAMDRQCQRKPCSFASNGTCRNKDSECKYDHTKCRNYESCSDHRCLLAHARGGKLKSCSYGIRCFKADCKFNHPLEWSACPAGVQCTNNVCPCNHPPGREKRPYGDNEPDVDILPQPKPGKNFETTPYGRLLTEPHSKSMCLDDAERHFLEFFGDKILNATRKMPGVVGVLFNDAKLQVTANRFAIEEVKKYLVQTLHKRDLTISADLKKYFELTCKPPLLELFSQKFRVGVSFGHAASPVPVTTHNTNIKINPTYKESDYEDDDEKNDTSDASFNMATVSKNFKPGRDHPSIVIRLTLCSDSEVNLTQAEQELCDYSSSSQCWTLTNDEVMFILKQVTPQETSQIKNPLIGEQWSLIRNFLSNFVRSNSPWVVQIYVGNTRGMWRVQVKGFKDHTKNAATQIKTFLNTHVDTEVQIPISKAMAVFLGTKASSDLRKLEKMQSIKILVMSPPKRKHLNEEQAEDGHDCLKLSGPGSRIHSGKENVENFLESLIEREAQFPCDSWNVSKIISRNICERLHKIQGSNDNGGIGWIKSYVASETRETNPKITLTMVGFNEGVVDEIAEQCQGIVEGYFIWKPSADEYRAISQALFLKKAPSIAEFQQCWGTQVQLNRDTGTITIPAQSRMLAEEIKEALLGLCAEKRPRLDRVSEFIHIEQNIRRFVNQEISALLDEARSRRVFVDLKNQRGLTLHGHSDMVNEIKQKINAIVTDIREKTITRRLKLSSAESNLLRVNRYEILRRIERETETLIRDVKEDSAGLILKRTGDDVSSVLATVVNTRGQTIAVEKGDITKAKHIDAIVNAANGSLYHAGGVDKAIANAAGPTLDAECKQLIVKNGGLPILTGTAVKTTAGELPFKCVIHAIGPRYDDGNQQERPLLFSSILKSLQLAEDEGYTSVALPAIGSQTYGFPMSDCTNIVIRAVKQFFADHPQAKLNKVVLMDVDETACNSFEREIAIDHRRDALSDEHDRMMQNDLPALTARWCWQDDSDEKIYNDNDTRALETAFQQFITKFIPPSLVIAADNLKSGTIVKYAIHFRPDLKLELTPNRGALNSRLDCGYQMRETTQFTRKIIRYPVEAQQQRQVQSSNYRPQQLDSYFLQEQTLDEYWSISGITDTAVKQAELAIAQAIHSATISDSFSVGLNKDLDNHKKELIAIATQQSIQITFQEDCSQRLSMILNGFKDNVSEAKFKIVFYAQDVLQMQVENDDELRIPKEWRDQEEDCKLVEIPRDDPSFVRIENRMRETMPNVKIDRIERVQNIHMWNHYALRRRELKKELRAIPNAQIEMELFHGTKTAPPNEIYHGEYGFDMTYCSHGMWGIGTYFAKNASYSCGTYRHQLPDGKIQVFLAQVLTGDVHDCPPDSALRRPPKKNEAVSGRRYNSVSGDTGGSKVYIVYENRVAYPTYLITFTSKL